MNIPRNRMAPTTTPKPALLPVGKVEMDLSKPPSALACPGCGRTISPYVVCTRPETGETVCSCGFCGQKFAYRPPSLRLVNSSAA